jgi:hypothetical protein
LGFLVEALLDIGALACFIDKVFEKQNLVLVKKPFSTHVEVIDGWHFASQTENVYAINSLKLSSIKYCFQCHPHFNKS